MKTVPDSGEKSANKSESAGEWAENVRLWTKKLPNHPGYIWTMVKQ